MTDKFLEVIHIPLSKGIATGISIATTEVPIIMIRTDKGFIMCGALDVPALDKLLPGKIAAAKVSGVKTFEDLLNKKVACATERAKSLGITNEMTGREALEKMI